MSFRVQNNDSSLFIRNAMNKNSTALSKNLAKLSSGYKINHAADDASGLAISESMKAQIKGYNAANQNIQDGISLIQTADGALAEVHTMLNRIEYIATRAANGVYTDIQRTKYDDEVQLLKREIDRIAQSTTFNDFHLLDGSIEDDSTKVKYHSFSEIPANTVSDDLIKNSDAIFVVDNQSGEITLYLPDPRTATIIPFNASNVQHKQIVEEIVPGAVKKMMDALPALRTLANNGQVSTAIGLILYTDPTDSAMASVASSYRYLYDNVNMELNLSINLSHASNRTKLESTVVHEMMHAFMYDVLPNGMLGFTNQYNTIITSSSFPLWFMEGMSQTVSGAAEDDSDWIDWALELRPNNVDNLSYVKERLNTNTSNGHTRLSEGVAGGSYAAQYGTGYLACMYLAHLANGKQSITSQNQASGVNAIIARIYNGVSLDGVIRELTNNKYYSADDFADRFHTDDDIAIFVRDLVKAIGEHGNGSIISGSLQDSDLIEDKQFAQSYYNPNPNRDFVDSTANGHRNAGTGSGGNDGINKGTTTILGSSNDPIGSVAPPTKLDLSTLKTRVDGSFTYNGSAFTPAIKFFDSGNKEITLDSSEYDIEYKDNINAGTATIIIKAKDGSSKYSGKINVTFTINKANFPKATKIADFEYTFDSFTNNEIDITKLANYDSNYVYTSSNESLMKIENGKIKFLQNVTNDTKVEIIGKRASDINHNEAILAPTIVTIKPKVIAPTILDLSTLKSSVNGSFTFDGNAFTPTLFTFVQNGKTIMLDSNDYTISYKDNINAGTATAILTAKDSSTKYKGSLEINFTIDKAYWAMMILEDIDYTYNSKDTNILDMSDTSIGNYYDSYIYTSSNEEVVKVNGKNLKILKNPDKDMKITITATKKGDNNHHDTTNTFTLTLKPDKDSPPDYHVPEKPEKPTKPSIEEENDDFAKDLNKPKNALVFHIGDDKNDKVYLNIDSMNASSLGIDNISVATIEKANEASALILDAINKVSSTRANLGAMQNRLTSTLNNNKIAEENLEQANSRIRDTDMAKTFSEFVALNVIINATQAMLSQSNSRFSQTALSILQS